MARTVYNIYEAMNKDATALKLLGYAEASSPAAAVRSWFEQRGEDNGEDAPTHLVVIAASALHQVAAVVETQTRLKLS